MIKCPNLTYITFTGADDQTSIEEMQKISAEFPLVEWGILLSQAGMGVKARFPSRPTLDLLAQAEGLRLSGHLCGSWMRNMVSKGQIDTAKIGPLWDKIKRVQLNFAGSESLAKDNFTLDQSKDFILQNRGVNLPENFNGQKYHILFDGSGGRGILAQAWPNYIQGKFCGYAGGLNTENIEEQLKLIISTSGDYPFWIDFESGVRTDDKFDLTKVRKILNIISNTIRIGQNS